MSVDHYENFPVASILLPNRLRRPIAAIYRFARGADDIADEGDASNEERLQELAAYNSELDRIEQGQSPADPAFMNWPTLLPSGGYRCNCFATCSMPLRRMSSRNATQTFQNFSTTAGARPIRSVACCCILSTGPATRTCVVRTVSAALCN